MTRLALWCEMKVGNMPVDEERISVFLVGYFILVIVFNFYIVD